MSSIYFPSPPQIGTLCEAQKPFTQDWFNVKILDTQGTMAVCRDEKDDLWWSNNFRPILTLEQIAAEERQQAIDDLVKVTCINHGEAARIYDAGYRKQVTP